MHAHLIHMAFLPDTIITLHPHSPEMQKHFNVLWTERLNSSKHIVGKLHDNVKAARQACREYPGDEARSIQLTRAQQAYNQAWDRDGELVQEAQAAKENGIWHYGPPDPVYSPDSPSFDPANNDHVGDFSDLSTFSLEQDSNGESKYHDA